MRKLALAVLLLLIFLPLVSAQIKIVEYKVDGTVKASIDGAGNAHVVETWKFTPNLYLQVKQVYPTTYMLKREFKNKRTDVEYKDMKIEWDDSNNQLKATYTVLGAAVNKGSYWECQPAEGDLTLSSTNGNVVVLTAVQPIFSGEGRLVETITVELPKNAKNVRFEEGVLKYELPEKSGGGKTLYLALAAVSAIGLVVLNLPLRR